MATDIHHAADSLRVCEELPEEPAKRATGAVALLGAETVPSGDAHAPLDQPRRPPSLRGMGACDLEMRIVDSLPIGRHLTGVSVVAESHLGGQRCPSRIQ